MIRFASQAREDMLYIQQSTAGIWGYAQSLRYVEMIEKEIDSIETGFSFKREVDDLPGIFACFVKWKRATYGHNIVFRFEENDVVVLRILHSAMDIRLHLG